MAEEQRQPTLYFEDFVVGRRFQAAVPSLEDRHVQGFAELTLDDHPLHLDADYAARTEFGRPVAHGALGLSMALGAFTRLGVLDDSVIALLDVRWRFIAPLLTEQPLQAEVVVTGRRRVRAGNAGVVHRHIRLCTQDGQTVQKGTSAVMVRARTTQPDRQGPPHRDFGTVAWGELLAKRLECNDDFVSACAHWDGTLGLQCDDRTVHLRIYRGRVIDVTRRAPQGATFTVVAEGITWVELALGPHNDALRRAHAGEITSTGDGYEYLRLTRALNVLWGEVRNLAHDLGEAA